MACERPGAYQASSRRGVLLAGYIAESPSQVHRLIGDIYRPVLQACDRHTPCSLGWVGWLHGAPVAVVAGLSATTALGSVHDTGVSMTLAGLLEGR